MVMQRLVAPFLAINCDASSFWLSLDLMQVKERATKATPKLKQVLLLKRSKLCRTRMLKLRLDPNHFPHGSNKPDLGSKSLKYEFQDPCQVISFS